MLNGKQWLKHCSLAYVAINSTKQFVSYYLNAMHMWLERESIQVLDNVIKEELHKKIKNK